MRKLILIAAISFTSVSAQAGMLTSDPPVQLVAAESAAQPAEVKPAQAAPAERATLRQQHARPRHVSLKMKMRYGYMKFKQRVRRSFARTFGR